MKRTALRAACLTVAFSFLLVGLASAQWPTTGTPPWSSFGGGPFDVVNLGNLNVHFGIPIRHKAGRGLPLAYDVTYDSWIWYPGTVNGVKTWQPSPVGYWGWQGLTTTPSIGNLTYAIVPSSGTCGQSNQYTWQQWQFTNLVYTDNQGAHRSGFSPYWIQTNPPNAPQCPANGPQPSTETGIPFPDGSGLTLYAITTGSTSMSWNVTTPSGTTFNNGSTGGGGGTDANGNEITISSAGVITDTLGVTALTISGAAPSNTTLSYAPPAGGTVGYTLSYKQYTIKTNFGCSGVAEYNFSQYLPDKLTMPDGTTNYQFQYEATAGGTSGQVTGRLTSVSLPTGGSITYTYPTTNSGANNGINCSDGSVPVASGSNPSLTRGVSPGGTWKYGRTLVSGAHWQTTITDPTSAANQTLVDFQQDSGTSNFLETERRVYQGSVVGGTLLSTTITCYNTVNPTPANCPTTALSTPISRRTVFSYVPDTSSGSQVSETDVQYAYISDPSFPTEVDSYDYGKGSPGAAIRKIITQYNAYGSNVQPTSIQIEDGGGNVKASTTYSYDQTAVQATSGTPQHTTVTGGRGNLTTISMEVSSTSTLYRTFTYWDTGNLYQATDVGTTNAGGPNVTAYTYGSCGNSFVTSVSEPLSLSKSFTWDCNGGVMTSATDENGQTASTYYTGSNFGQSADPDYWRPYGTTDQLNNPTTLNYPSNTVTERALLFNNSSSVVDVRTKLDAFGRLILNQTKEGPTSSSYDSTQTDFDIAGRVSKTYLPFTNTADAPCSGSCPGVVTAYDALNRPLTATDGGGGTITYTYTNNDVYQTVGPAPSGQNAKRKQLEYDGLGRLKSVCEISSASGSGTCSQTNSQTGFWTTYTYDALGDLTGVTQNAQAGSGSQQTRSFTYDGLGRMTSESNPETGNNGANGTTTYTYDEIPAPGICNGDTGVPGDLTKVTRPDGSWTCYLHDALHRLTDIGNSNQSTTNMCKRFRYDNSPGYAGSTKPSGLTNTYGRMIEAATDTCSGSNDSLLTDEWFSYSARGEVTDVWESTPDSGGYYHVNATYWAHGRLNVLNGGTSPLPGLPAITYGASDGSGMDGKGRITKVTAASGKNPANSVSWNAGNQVTGITLGSLDSDAYQYDPNTGRMTQYQFNMGTGPKSQTGVLTWNANGTLQQMQLTDQINTANTQTCSYAYDDLTRITSANCGSTWAQTFSLDPFGNLSKSGSAAFQPTYTGASGTNTTPSNQYYQISGGGSGASNYYDANGNLTNDLTHSYTWNAYGDMSSVDGTTTTMIYDAMDRMVEQTRSSGHTEIVYGPYGMKLALMNGQTFVSAFVKIPGGARAVYKSSGLAYYRHSDHLGNSRLATTPSRGKYYDVAYAPYGEDYNGSGSTADLAFTDENQDTVAGGWTANLYDFMFREYRTGHGRWTQPDPAGVGAVDPTNPQTWNRYAYVTNNPMAMIDLLGDDGCYVGGVEDTSIGDDSACSAAGGSWVQYFSDSNTTGVTASPDPVETIDAGGLDPTSIAPFDFSGGNGVGGSGGGPNNETPQNPCNYAGRNLNPSAWEAMGQNTRNNPVTTFYDFKYGFAIGGYLDGQPLASGTLFEKAAYGNYVFGVYMSAAGFPLSVALAGANAIAQSHTMSNPSQYSGRTMDTNYPALPAANVTNITAGYNAQRNGTLCHK